MDTQSWQSACYATRHLAQESHSISTMQNMVWMLLGAALVSIGVLASALADRIRGLAVSREGYAPRERATRATSVPVAPPVIPVMEVRSPPKPPRVPRVEPKAAGTTDGGDDVIAALVAAGYKKPVATEAVWACGPAERASIERWTRAALVRCVRGGMS